MNVTMNIIQNLTVIELSLWLKQDRPQPLLLDVREDNEVAICALSGSQHIPMNLIPMHQNQLPDDRPIVIYCHHGRRSLSVAQFLANVGFSNLYNLTGGIDAWALDVDATLPRY